MNPSMTSITAFQYSMIDNMLSFFERQASCNADSIALLCGDQQVTYGELDRRSNQLAWHLQKRSVKPETLVGVCTTRSIEMIVAILGVLKAGGAYVPLDPTYPKERLSFILADARAPVVITQKEFSGAFSGQHIRKVHMDCDWAEICSNPVEPPVYDATADDLAYVIYTSGSTGQPKGVMVSHANLMNFIRISSQVLDVNGSDVYLQTASIAYALSVRQIMVPLSMGARLVIASAEEMRDPIALFELIKSRNVTLMDMVPSFWRTCLQRLSDLPPEELEILLDNSLRRIVSVGEPLVSDLPQQWKDRFGSKVQLVNIFGQTETTGMVTAYPIPEEAPKPAEIVPVGHAIPDTRLYLLDPDLRPVPPGEEGELCVSNPCMARGYLNHPDLTEKKFIPNPFDDGLNSRLYRTGDLARVREDGSLEYIGRRDHQVKIRGQRLDLGEVETLLRCHPAVSNCAVSVRGDSPDENHLVAYVIPAAGQTSCVSELMDFARKRVPDYMVPQIFVFLESFPLTPNGKLDRLALPDPSSVEAAKTGFVKGVDEPRNPIEKSIAQIWMDLLKVDQVGIHDDYFDLGGSSLLAVRMFSRIERDLGVRLPYTSLFQATTVAQLARLVVDKNERDLQSLIVVPIRDSGGRPPFFGVHGQEGGVLFWRDMVGHLPPDQPFYAVQAQGVDGLQPPLNRIPAMAELYIREIRKVQPKGPYYLGGYSLGGEIAFEMAQQLTAQGEQIDLLVLFDTRNPKRSIRMTDQDDNGSVMPAFESSPTRYETLKRKVKGHLLRLSDLTVREKFVYGRNELERRIHRRTAAFSVRAFQSLQRKLPDAMLQNYIRENHIEALTNYIPVKYPGRVTLFRATETLLENPTDSMLGWVPLAGGGLKVYLFEASHELLRVEYAQKVAARLNDCLLKAQTIDQRSAL
jgi:amino acid adenylation domain-containing protein